MYDTILVPVDGSDSMAPIVEDAATLAAERGASAHLLYVVDKRAFLTLAEDRRDEVMDELEAQGSAALEVASATMKEHGVSVETHLQHGDPADKILALADEIGADLIAMGTHARFEDNILGSVSRTVVIEADIPVLATPLSEP
ncbi:universal stress protein [Haloferax sp. S1W]|uniref:universal stress protein n=1 Tax=Haloferax sp. S1W TaxID=3377110 RepID=UPI0037C54355